MSNQADYYLESLITEAFKGKGFQKITEIVEEKISCSFQRHGKALLNVLDRLINKELDRNEFKHVTLLMKCVQHFCKHESQEDFSLIQQGLVSKMVLWFERTLEFLKIWDETSLLVPELVEEFYDTAVVICRSNNRDGVKQLLDSFLFHLGYIIAEKWPAFNIQLEAIKTFNHILDHISREDKKSLQSSEEMSTLLKIMAGKLFDVGDYDGQVAISEALCRMTPRKMRENLVRHWFDDLFFANAFLDINDKDFETDCRIFLNCLNLRSQDAIRVYTYPCVDAFADTEKLTRPQDSKLEHFWIDFNIGSNSISFYIQNPKGVLWDSVRLSKGSIAGYNLQEVCKQKQLEIYPKTHIVINTKETKHVRIYFENEHDIESAVVKTYGEEMKMVIRNQDTNNESTSQATSPTSIGTFVESNHQLWQKGQSKSCKTEEASSEELPCQSNECPPSEVNTNSTGKDSGSIKPQEALKDFNEVDEPSNPKKTPLIVCRDVRVVLSPVLKRIMDHTPKDVKATCSETKGSTPKKQHAEKSLSKFEFPSSSQSGTDIELVMGTVESPESSTKRTLELTPSRPITRASLTDQKKPKSGKRGNVVSSASAAESEKSWILEHKKSADYSRKKKKPKSKLKVLPLSSESSNEDILKKMPRSSSFTVLKQTRTGKGRAESLSFSDVNLSGVSGLLTPGNTTRQSSALTISDVDDKDIMDPVQEMSSPELVPLAKNSVKDFQRGFSSTNVSKAVAEDDTEPQQKRKRLNSEEIALMFQPRKLFGSCENNSVKSEAALSSSHAEDIAECSFISSFEGFTKQLQNKMMCTYKNMEIQAQDMLTASHLHVSNLISQIQECKTRKLNRFHEIVVQELSTLEADTQALRELEKETLEIWENQTLKVKQFCVNQSKRLEAVLGETNSLLTKNDDQLKDVTESSEKPTNN
ncbi:synaptonemal complex protein 2-like isoform X2 [Rana temporaria]|uniref:synaptonemal complex protein 2-like isoform X2 n=1 Tax=Rana temporaria TaxID=8407 RepID=UPI001AAC5392|nr:synaptonemal complex protein 2-like isoform X2 [Rana temporaria]